MDESPNDRLRSLVRDGLDKLVPIVSRVRARVEAFTRGDSMPASVPPPPLEATDAVDSAEVDRERDRLVEKLATDDTWQGRVVAANGLAEFRGDLVVDALIRAVRDPSAEVAVAAVASLACQPEERAMADLVEILHQSEAFIGPLTRAAAVEAIARARGVAALPILLDALHDGDAEVSMAAVNAAARVAPAESAPKLRALLEDHSGYYLPVVRITTAKAMERAGVLDLELARALLASESNEGVRVVLERVIDARA